MKGVKSLLLAGGMILGGTAVPAQATPGDASAVSATTLVNFSFDLNGVSAAHGSFSYDSAKTGQLTYADLLSFEFALPDTTYDLSFVTSSDVTSYVYFGWNATSNTFVKANVGGYGGGFDSILGAVASDANSGFFTGYESNLPNVFDYSSSNYTDFDTVSTAVVTSAVPEPAGWSMMLVGLGLVAGAARYGRRSMSVSFA